MPKRRACTLSLALLLGVGLFLVGPELASDGLGANERAAVSTTAVGLAHDLDMRVIDAGHVVTLEGPFVTVRLYPGTNRVSVQGVQHRMRGRVAREGDRIRIPGLPARFLTRQIYAARQQVVERRRTAALPPPRPLKPVPAPRPMPVVPRGIELLRPSTPTPLRPQPVATRKEAVLPPDPSWMPRAAARDWRWIVVHHSDDTSGNAEKYDRVHREVNGWDSLGYHFVIGNGSLSGDGEIEIGPRWPIQKHGAHARNRELGHNNFNEHGVGICLVGDFESTGCVRPTRRQMDQLVRLTRWLMARYGIPASRVIGHRDCCKTECPGRFFPWDEYQKRLRTAEAVPATPPLAYRSDAR